MLDGPRWLAQRRAEAWERFSTGKMPTEAEEVWRYSGIDDFDLDAFAPARPLDADMRQRAHRRAAQLAERLGPRSALVVTCNGTWVEPDGASEFPDGLMVAQATDEPPPTLGERAGADAFGDLHDAFVPAVTVVHAGRKVSVAEPVVLVHLIGGGGSDSPGVSAFPRTVVRVDTSGALGVIEIMAPLDDDALWCLAVPVTEMDVADDGALRYASLQALGTNATVIGRQSSRIGRDGRLQSFTAGLGGRYARVRTDSDLLGTGGATALLAAYLGTGSQVHDFRTLQDHHAGHTDSELLFKGAVADSARSVYSGLIRIRKGARRADARQTNHNLVLSAGAHADSVPNLDIDENDVRCSHASTVGPIDEDQRYYLESRGIEPAVAQRLIVLGFFADLAARAPYPHVSRWVEDQVRARLKRTQISAPDPGGPGTAANAADGAGDG